MLKKTLLSVAVASSIALTGCLDDAETGNNSQINYEINNPDIDIREGKTSPIFNPVTSELPIPNDLIWDKAAGDGSFNVADIKPPVTTALNDLSGASTTAPIDIAFSGGLNSASINTDQFMKDSNGNVVYHPDFGYALPNPTQNVFLIELDYASGDPLQGLSNAEPPTVPFANHYATLASASATPEEKVAAITAINTAAANPAYSAEVLDMQGTTVLRIHPETPLKPRTRYIVTLTNEIKDAAGTNIIPSLLYEDLTKTNEELSVGNSALFAVRDLMNGLWEAVSSNYFQLNNSSRAQAGLASLTDKNIALSYSFMTSGDEKVMEYIANPAEWFSDQISNFVRVSAAKAVVSNKTDANGDGKVDYTDVKLAAGAGIAYFPTNPSNPTDTTISDALAPVAAGFPLVGCTGVTSGQTYIDCVGLVLANAPVAKGGFKELLPTPKARTVTTTSANQPVSLVSSVVSKLITDPTKPPLVSQGTISIPYYLGIPTGNTAAEGAVINTESWTADHTLASAINTAFAGLGLQLPQGVASGTGGYKSNVVNYIYPFPAQLDGDPQTDATDLNIPWLAVRPYPTVASKGTVIFQHGITTDRSASLSVGTVLAQQGYTVIAIDQAVHGIAPASTSTKLGLAATLLAAGQQGGLPASLAPSDSNNQAVVDGTINIGFVIAAFAANMQQTIDATTAQGVINTVVAGGTTGSASLDTAILTLESFENTVANAGSIIPGIANTSFERHFNFTADSSVSPTPMDFDADTAFGSSGSLYINLQNFTNSRDKSRQGVIDLLNLRQSLTSIDLNGDGTADVDTSKVYFIGHSLGTLSGIPMVSIANSVPTVGNFDASVFLEPASGISRMVENSGSFAPRIVGGLAALGIGQGSTSFETFLNVLQAALDSVDPINFADNLGRKTTGSFQTNADVEGALFIQNVGTADANGATVYKSDQTNPIEAETTQLTTQFGTSFKSAFAGIEQLTTLIGATDVIGATPDGTADIIRTRLAFGNHGMFVLPVVTAKEQEDKGLTDEQKDAEELLRGAAFQEGLMQTATFFLLDGEMAGATSTSGTTSVPGILIDETTYNARPNKQLN
ncbi:MAG: Ig-like domain-containing protein [Hahellaceae bacterium]|nr:Ig-like domain-containing protein [Hahellaceae bacterium]MCP5211936.1 Ig-like domain-containing protein [Hahellaceae bacterium]